MDVFFLFIYFYYNFFFTSDQWWLHLTTEKGQFNTVIYTQITDTAEQSYAFNHYIEHFLSRGKIGAQI